MSPNCSFSRQGGLKFAQAPQIAALAPTPSAVPPRQDYGWLSDTILRRVEELKRYPPEARLDRAEGKVVLKAVIRADGSITDVKVLNSVNQRLDDSAVAALHRWRFHPGSKENQAVDVEAVVQRAERLGECPDRVEVREVEHHRLDMGRGSHLPETVG